MTKSESVELLPCPWCGNEEVAQGAFQDAGEQRLAVQCWNGCRAFGPSVAFPLGCDPGPAVLEAITLWNTRTQETKG